jgi:hypothetical protein
VSTTGGPNNFDLERAKLAGRLEAESEHTVRNEQRDAAIKKVGAVAAVAAVVLLIWQPWNAGQRQAQAASDAYYTAHTALLGCTEQSTASTVAGCWETFSGALSSISWPPVLTSDSAELVSDVDAVANSLQGNGSYESALATEGGLENRVTAELTQLTNGG